MRRSLLALALLGTTALTPVEAHAGPVAGFIAGAASFLTTGATVGAGVGGAFAAGSATAAFLAGPIGSIVLSVGLSAVSTLLQPRPELAPKPSARMVNYAQPVTYMERVYGRVRKGGPLAFTGFKASNRAYSVILAAHEIEGYVQHWLDERPVTLANGASGISVTDPPGDSVNVQTYRGTWTQPSDPTLQALFPEWTVEHNMRGLAHAVVIASRTDPEKFAETYPSGREPAYTPVIDGHNRIYDPRSNSFGYTRNAALIVAHELTRHQGREVDWDAVAVEADVCDRFIVNGDGVARRRWTLNGTISDDQEWEDIRTQMMAACDCFVFERADGRVGFRVGRWTEPEVTLTERDFLALELTEGEDMGAPTEFSVQYVESANRWRESASGVWVEEPSGRRVREDVAAYMVNNHTQAVSIAKRVARARRARYSLTGTVTLSGYNLIGQRFARFTHAQLGLDFPIEVGRLVWNADRVTFGLEAVSAAPEDFDFDAALEEPERPRIGLPASSDEIPPVTGLSAQAVQSTGGAAALEWTWPSQKAAYRQQLRYRRTADAEWQYAETSAPGQTVLVTTGLLDGGIYEGQVRNRTGGGRASEWKPDATVQRTAVANQEPPVALTTFGASSGDPGEVLVAFTAPNDAQYFATRVWRGETTNLANATPVHTEYGIPSNSDSWTDTALSSGTWYYWGEPINSSGVPGPKSGPAAATAS